MPLGPSEIALESAQTALDENAAQKAAAFTPDEGRLVIDIRVEPEPRPGERLAYESCIAEQDAARLRAEIIVCRRIDNGEAVSGFDKAKWERDYARRTQGVTTPDVEGVGGSILMPGEGSLITVTYTQKGCFVGPCAPEKALIIDVEALPEAPPGSDAGRIARGLAPLGED